MDVQKGRINGLADVFIAATAAQAVLSPRFPASSCVNAICTRLVCGALPADTRNESAESQVRAPGWMLPECRDVETHQHSAQGRWVQALSDLALSFVTALLCRHLHVPHCHSNSVFFFLFFALCLSFPLPRVSARATALKMLNIADARWELVNGAAAAWWVCLAQYEGSAFQHNSIDQIET